MRISDWSSDVCSSDLFNSVGAHDHLADGPIESIRLRRRGVGVLGVAQIHEVVDEQAIIAIDMTDAANGPAPGIGEATEIRNVGGVGKLLTAWPNPNQSVTHNKRQDANVAGPNPRAQPGR